MVPFRFLTYGYRQVLNPVPDHTLYLKQELKLYSHLDKDLKKAQARQRIKTSTYGQHQFNNLENIQRTKNKSGHKDKRIQNILSTFQKKPQKT